MERREWSVRDGAPGMERQRWSAGNGASEMERRKWSQSVQEECLDISVELLPESEWTLNDRLRLQWARDGVVVIFFVAMSAIRFEALVQDQGVASRHTFHKRIVQALFQAALP